MAPRREKREAAIERAEQELAEAERLLDQALDEAERKAQSPENLRDRKEIIAPDGSRHIFHGKPVDAFLDKAVVDRYNGAVLAWHRAHGWEGSAEELEEMMDEEEDDFFDDYDDDDEEFLIGQPGPSRRPQPRPQPPRRRDGNAPRRRGNVLSRLFKGESRKQ